MRFRHVYDIALLWLLSHIGQRAVETIYKHGYDDGANALREEMRAEVIKVYTASSTERMRAYDRGFADAMHYFDADDLDIVGLPGERVH
jgi:hypothetical protein